MNNFTDEFIMLEDFKFWSMQVLAKIYLESSMICAVDSKKILENKDDQNYYENSKYLKNVIGSIVFSAMYLEATINEFFITTVEELGNSKVSPNSRNVISKLWKLEKIEKLSVIDKYQIALILLEKDQFNDTIKSFQNIKLLISFRNYLVHYKPDWMEINSSDNTRIQILKLEKNLTGKFKVESKSEPIDNQFPVKFLNTYCAEWGIESSIEFVNEFYRRAEIDYLYKDIIDILKAHYGLIK